MKSPIINIQTYHMAMQRIDALIALEALSADEVTDLKKLAIAVEAFEEQHFPVR